MEQCDEVRDYWNTGAKGYSLRNADELDGESGRALAELFEKELQVRPGMRALDVGCGPGILSVTLAKAGCSVTGVDLSPGMLEEARRNAERHGVEPAFMEGNAEELPFEDGTFDVVVSRWLVWNLPHPQDAYAEWLRVLKPGGSLLVIDGNHYRYLHDPRYRSLKEGQEVPGHAEKYMQGVSTAVIDRIAETLPLTDADRPAWDVAVLEKLGARPRVVTANRERNGQESYSPVVVTGFVIAALKA